MATFGLPAINTANIVDGAITSAKIALDTVVAADIAENGVGDSEIAAHTTTKITSPFSLVTGTVGITQGGTGQVTATPAFDALAPTTTQGDIIYHNGTDNVRLGFGTSGQFLKTQGTGANPIWDTVSAQPAWSLIETLTSAGGTTNLTFASFTAVDMLMLVINATSVDDLTLTVNGASANTYDYTSMSDTAIAQVANAASWVLSSGAADVSAANYVYYLGGKLSGGTARLGIHGTGNIFRNEAISILRKGSVGGAANITALTIGLGGIAMTGKAKLYGLNL